MGTAKKLPGNIAKRWKVNKQKESKEDSQWKEIESKKSKTPKAMIDAPSGKRAKSANKKNKD